MGMHLAFIEVLLCTTLSRAAEVSLCQTGYGISRKARVISFPPETVRLSSRTTIECATLCAATRNCLQLYFNSSTGHCYIISSVKSLSTSPSSFGSVLSNLNPRIDNQRMCSNGTCSEGAACVTDCSPKFGGAMCVADNDQCFQETHVISVAHYYNATPEDGRNIGNVFTVFFNKTRNDTALRVLWFATTRVQIHDPFTCGRYYATFNGSNCSNPNNIDLTNFDASSINHHQLSELDGICYALPAGVTQVSIAIGPCPSYGTTDFHTGYRASASMWVYEMTTAQSSEYSQCSSLPVMNTNYRTILNMQNNNSDPEHVLTALTYQKISLETVLRVKWQGTARIYVPFDSRWCARWYITVDGVECNPRAEFILGMYNGTSAYARDNHRTRTLEGFCYGIHPGTHNIELRVGFCSDDPGPSDTFTGGVIGSVSRMTISEVRMQSTTQAVTTADDRILKLPFFNLNHWWFYRLNSDADKAILFVSTYKKSSDTSGLHLRAVGSTAILRGSTCCRWYFTINSIECQNPGAIEGIEFIDTTISYHNPSVVDGACYGLPSGTYTIGYNVGNCTQYSVGDCYTGWASTLHIIAEEVQPDLSITCSNLTSCP